MQIEIADRQDSGDEEDAHCHHQIVGTALLRYEEWQVVRRHRMILIAHLSSLQVNPTLREYALERSPRR
jgi:hypothetical protein